MLISNKLVLDYSDYSGGVAVAKDGATRHLAVAWSTGEVTGGTFRATAERLARVEQDAAEGGHLLTGFGVVAVGVPSRKLGTFVPCRLERFTAPYRRPGADPLPTDPIVHAAAVVELHEDGSGKRVVTHARWVIATIVVDEVAALDATDEAVELWLSGLAP